MRILDINAALGAPTKSERFRDGAGLLHWMDDYRIDCALAYDAESLREPLKGNQQALATAAASGGRIKTCLALDPAVMSWSVPGTGTVCERLRAARPSAVRVFPENNGYLMNAFYARGLLEAMNALRMPVIVDGAYSPAFYQALPEMAQKFPDVRFILLRVGFNASRTINPLLSQTRNVYFDMSVMLDTGQMEEVVRDHGSERLLFGSGLPQYEPSGALALLLYAQIPEADRARIAHLNFERLEGEIRYEL